MTNYRRFFVFCGLLFFLTSCASQPNVNNYGAPGFFSGLFHGFFILFAFVGSLLIDDISIYAFPNSGGWYDFGYIIGISAFSYFTDESIDKAK